MRLQLPLLLIAAALDAVMPCLVAIVVVCDVHLTVMRAGDAMLQLRIVDRAVQSLCHDAVLLFVDYGDAFERGGVTHALPDHPVGTLLP